jgi:hypothetical protein
MNTKLIKLSLLLLSLQVLLPVHIVLADTGPKPTMEFAFKQELTGEQITIASGVLFECEQPDCSDAAPLEDVGPQGLYCEPQSCRAIGYGFAPYHRLEIEFSDGVTRKSNIFETVGFDSSYTVTVRPDDLLVEAQFNLLPSFSLGILEVIACICALIGGVSTVGLKEVIHSLPVTIIIEGVFGLAYSIWRKKPLGPILITSIFANLITQSLLWIVLNIFFEHYLIALSLAEILIWMIESFLLYRFPANQLRLQEAALISLVMNLSSFVLGWYLPI